MPIQIGEIEGTAVVRSSNGAISVDRAGAGVDAKTSNGSIRLGEVAREADGTVEVRGRTSFGDITIHRSRVGGEDTGSEGAFR